MLARLEGFATVVIALAAVAVATVVVRREFSRPADSGRVQEAPSYVEDWKSIDSAGLSLGESSAKVRIVAFSDLECPFCKKFHESFRALRQSGDVDVSVAFVHFPLPSHRFATIAAQAAECASDRGKAESFLDAAFEKQDSLGLKSWGAFAHDIGIKDTAAFARCSKSSVPAHRITRGLQIGRAHGVRGTPTLIINGWRVAAPRPDSLLPVIRAVLDGKPPFRKAASR